MTNHANISSGALFIRYLVVGLVLIIASLITFRLSAVGDEYSILLNAAALLLLNIGTITLFTKAILSNEALLVQEDAADHAYYLGFCLTVASLAFSFGVDAILNPLSQDPKAAAEGSSELIKGSLLQFSAGLSATIIGLCAKIYISSEQIKLNAEPEELYRQFRQEIYRFQGEMRSASSDLSAAFREVSASLVNSAKNAQSATEELLHLVQENTKTLSRNLSAKRLETSTANFIVATEKMALAAEQVNSELNPLGGSVGDLSNAISSVSSNLQDLTKASAHFSSNTVATSNEMDTLNQLVKGVSAEFGSMQAVVSNNAAQIALLNQAVMSLNEVTRSLADTGLTRLSQASESSSVGLENLVKPTSATSKALSEFYLELEKLATTLPSVKESLRETDFSGLIRSINELKKSLG